MIKILNKLKLFFEEPQREVHIREYAKIIGKSPATALKYLEDFAGQGLLTSRKGRVVKLYKANEDSDLFKDMKRFYNIQKVRSSGLVDFLVDEFNEPEAIILFGSYAHATNDKESDLDICVISPRASRLSLSKYEKKLKAGIQLFVFSKKELKSNKELANNIINGIKLYGFIEVF